MKKILLLTFALIITISNMTSQEKEPLLLIETNLGNIKIKLYNETPKHRDNMLKLVKEDFYKDLLFHRVIKDFMIQGGDPNSRTASDSAPLGDGDLDYMVDAEFMAPQLFHKRGALAAARMADGMNPEQKSSASQFYITVGRVFSETELQGMEWQRFERLKQSILKTLQAANSDVVKELYRRGDKIALGEFRAELQAEAEDEAETRKNEIQFTAKQRELYTTIGGTPHLDGAYTVFGEVVDGFDVIDKIQVLDTNGQDRPTENVRMNIILIEE